MRNFNKKIIIIYLLLIFYLLITSIFINKIVNIYNMYLNPIFWCLLALISLLIFGFKETRYKGLKDKLQIIGIIILAYIFLYFLSGLLFDFVKNIYSTKIDSLIKNIWMFVSILLFKEIVREKLIHNSGTKFIYAILITAIFIISDIEIFNINIYFQSKELTFKYFFSIIFPIITSNIVCTYLVSVGGYKSSCLFRLPIALINYIIPIQPNLDWFMIGLFNALLPVIIYLFISRFHILKTNRKPKKEVRYSNPRVKFILIGFLIIFGFFVGGLFKYKPVAVMSGSMEPIFYRGDIVIVEQLNEENCQKLKLYDIIEYKLEDRIVLHRIIKIENKEGKLIFITKGDNNEIADKEPVEVSQVSGKIKFVVKYIGYPSVLLNEYFSN